MNIFALSECPIISAQSQVDKHVVKMILETAQLLCTAHRVLDGEQYVGKTKTDRNVKRWRLPDDREHVMYSATHINHPSAVWCRQTNNNYNWLYCHFIALLAEYTHRYGKKHKSEFLVDLLVKPPYNIPNGSLTPVTPAMDKKYLSLNNDSVESYRNYYRHGKVHLHKYTNRTPPEWLFEV